MVVYVDSSVLARAYLPDEDGHEQAAALLSNPELALVTGSWGRIEVSGALVRAARRTARATDTARDLLRLLNADLGTDGRVTVLAAPQRKVETLALELVVAHGIRAMDAWHLAVADLVARELADPGAPVGFASRDMRQAAVAEQLGFAATVA